MLADRPALPAAPASATSASAPPPSAPAFALGAALAPPLAVLPSPLPVDMADPLAATSPGGTSAAAHPVHRLPTPEWPPSATAAHAARRDRPLAANGAGDDDPMAVDPQTPPRRTRSPRPLDIAPASSSSPSAAATDPADPLATLFSPEPPRPSHAAIAAAAAATSTPGSSGLSMHSLFASPIVSSSSPSSSKRLHNASVDQSIPDRSAAAAALAPPAPPSAPTTTASSSAPTTAAKPVPANEADLAPYPTDPINPRTAAERGALATYAHIADNVYQSARLGLAQEADDFPCACKYRNGDKPERACGSDQCLNRVMFIECRPGTCPVGKHCRNRRFQNHEAAPVEVFHADAKGFGLRTLAPLPADTFVLEYVGDVITRSSFLRRAKQYAAEGCKHFYFMALQGNQLIDAQKRGGLARFINHSCRPNCATQKWVVADKLRIGLFTTRPVARGEELTFDYKFERYGAQAQPCYCGEDNCSGFIGATRDERAAAELGTMVIAPGAEDEDDMDVDGMGDEFDDEDEEEDDEDDEDLIDENEDEAEYDDDADSRTGSGSGSMRRSGSGSVLDKLADRQRARQLKRKRANGLVRDGSNRKPNRGAGAAHDAVDRLCKPFKQFLDDHARVGDAAELGETHSLRFLGTFVERLLRASTRVITLFRSAKGPLLLARIVRRFMAAPKPAVPPEAGGDSAAAANEDDDDDDNSPMAQLHRLRKVTELLIKMPIAKRNTVEETGLAKVVADLSAFPDDVVANRAKQLVESWAALEIEYRIPKVVKPVRLDSESDTASSSRRGDDSSSRSSATGTKRPRSRSASPRATQHRYGVPRSRRKGADEYTPSQLGNERYRQHTTIQHHHHDHHHRRRSRSRSRSRSQTQSQSRSRSRSLSRSRSGSPTSASHARGRRRSKSPSARARNNSRSYVPGGGSSGRARSRSRSRSRSLSRSHSRSRSRSRSGDRWTSSGDPRPSKRARRGGSSYVPHPSLPPVPPPLAAGNAPPPANGWIAYPTPVPIAAVGTGVAPPPAPFFFFHPITREARWEMPAGAAPPTSGVGAAPVPPPPPPQSSAAELATAGSAAAPAAAAPDVDSVVEAARRAALAREEEQRAAAESARRAAEEEERTRRRELAELRKAKGAAKVAAAAASKPLRTASVSSLLSLGGTTVSPASSLLGDDTHSSFSGVGVAARLGIGSEDSPVFGNGTPGSSHHRAGTPAPMGSAGTIASAAAAAAAAATARPSSAPAGGSNKHPSWFRNAVGKYVAKTLSTYRARARETASAATTDAHPLENDDTFKAVARSCTHEILAAQNPIKGDAGSGAPGKEAELPDKVKVKVKAFIKKRVDKLVREARAA
ncbi:hypothetical protein H9P43_003720 [Blastocladiella emersonii ATCC 22665]|nr:hypothetical protein H9P43_003720 [Blastocladiella emersonii ATCC 22665]